MLRLLLGVFRDLFRSQASLEAEIVTLRHQVAVLRRGLGRKELQLTWPDRVSFPKTTSLLILSKSWQSVYESSTLTMARHPTAPGRTPFPRAPLGCHLSFPKSSSGRS
jgi:hypothetical protein